LVRRGLGALITLLLFVATGELPVRAGADLARTFTPVAVSPAVYGIQAPDADPARQRHIVKAADGVDLFTEAWLPAASNGHVPPSRVPVVVVMSPYVVQGTLESARTMQALVTRGYGYVQMHVRGFGNSGGCVDLFGPKEADDGARVISWLGTAAPYSNGVVGGYGVSYPGGTIVNAAGRGDPSLTSPLKAIVVGAPEVSEYDARWMFDGVPSTLVGPLHVLNYEGQSYLPNLMSAPVATPQQLLQKPVCQPRHTLTIADQRGDFTRYYAEHENRGYVHNIKAAVLMTHGHADLIPIGGVPPMVQAGLFDELPATTPKAGIFGVFGHQNPPRADWIDTMVGWFDHWLKGLDTGAETWPVAQVQGTDGQWRAEPDWPHTGGPVGQLALGLSGTMGESNPTADTAYLQPSVETTAARLPGTFAVFQTAPLADRLELTGQPVLDLWLKLGLPDAHVAAKLETFDANGAAIANGWTYGLRSARHLDPMVDDRFQQAKGKSPSITAPVHVPVRFQPTDLVIPKGGFLRVTIAGSLIVNSGLSQLGIPEPLFMGPSQPSPVPNVIRILHGCPFVSALRFEMPRPDPDLLHVLQVAGAPVVPVTSYPVSDGGGLATGPVCGLAPTRPAA
jgi:predicted acyl esterase